MSICKVCGAQINDGAKVCGFCGSPVTSGQPAQQSQYSFYGQQTPANTQQAAVDDYGFYSSFMDTPSAYSKSNRSSGRGAAITSVIFFAFSFLCSGLGLAMSIMGIIAPHWGHYYTSYSSYWSSYTEFCQDFDSDFIAVLSIIGICVFGIMILLSIAGAIINLVSANKQRK